MELGGDEVRKQHAWVPWWGTAFQVPGAERRLECLEHTKPREKMTRGEDGEEGKLQKA